MHGKRINGTNGVTETAATRTAATSIVSGIPVRMFGKEPVGLVKKKAKEVVLVMHGLEVIITTSEASIVEAELGAAEDVRAARRATSLATSLNGGQPLCLQHLLCRVCDVWRWYLV